MSDKHLLDRILHGEPMTRIVLAASVVVVLGAGGLGCRDLPRAAPAAPAGLAIPVLRPPQTPAGVAALIHDLRVARRYGDLENWIAHDRRGQSTRLLQMVDELLAANERVLSAADRRFGAGVASGLDLGLIRNNLGLFSETITIVREEPKGETAEVIVQEADNLPLARERFELRGNLWYYAPDDLSAAFLDDLRRLAESLGSISGRLERGEMTLQQLHESYSLQIIPIIDRIENGGRGARAR